MKNAISYSPTGYYAVVAKIDYVIGVILFVYLCHFMARRPDLNNLYGRVKLRINGNNANEIVPILNRDPLNHLFFNEYEPEETHFAEI